MIRINDLQLMRGGRILLDGANLSLNPGQRLGLVGSNGCGKSSLFALLRGQLEADRGAVDIPSQWQLAWVEQEVAASDRTALQYTIDGDLNYRRLERELAQARTDGDTCGEAEIYHQLEQIDGFAIEARAARLLHGLGFSHDQQGLPVASFSGGWQMRLNLARALLCRSDLLLLDEPTNHLDLDALVWLQQWLCRYPGTLIMISHDRDFLDQVVDTIVHIEHSTLNPYSGNYSEFERLRVEQFSQREAVFSKQQRQRAHLQQFVDRFRAKATKAKQAQSRLKALEKLQAVAPAYAHSSVSFEFRPPEALASPLIHLDRVSVGYGGSTILSSIQVDLLPGSRIGLLGRNGAGKSTFIKLLAGEIQPATGEYVPTNQLKVGYFAQHQLEALRVDSSPYEHLRLLAPEEREQTLRDYLGSFGFHGDDALSMVGPMSGGEKARLALAILIWQRPNMLLLDEPTNHLDIDMRQSLVMALQNYQGAVVLVSHDRHLLRTVVDDFYLVKDGVVGRYTGTLEDYQKQLLATDTGQSTVPAKTAGAGSSSERRDRKRLEANFRQQTRPLRQQLERLEQQMDQLSVAAADIDSMLADEGLYAGDRQPELKALLQEQAAVKVKTEQTESTWLEAQEALELMSLQLAEKADG